MTLSADDRIALILGRAIMQAERAAVALTAQQTEIAAIKAEQERLARELKPKRAATRRPAK